MKEFNVGELAEGALNAACKHIQDELGIKTGDVAGQFFSGEVHERAITMFALYVLAEAQFERQQPKPQLKLPLNS